MIYDCFIFYNELDLLEIRLNELNGVVDYFVLVEAEKTHQNKEKELFFENNKNRFSNFLNKIIYIKVPGYLFSDDCWKNERLQRNFILKGLQKAKEDDLLLVSDLDEIPSEDAVNRAISNNKFPVVFEQQLHYYYLNTPLKIPSYSFENNQSAVSYKSINCGTVLLTKGEFENNTEVVRNLEKYNFDTISNGGWHFSFLGNESTIYNKLQNYAHAEYNDISIDVIKNNYVNMKDPLGRPVELGLNKDISYLPKYVLDNLPKFIKYIKVCKN